MNPAGLCLLAASWDAARSHQQDPGGKSQRLESGCPHQAVHMDLP